MGATDGPSIVLADAMGAGSAHDDWYGDETSVPPLSAMTARRPEPKRAIDTGLLQPKSLPQSRSVAGSVADAWTLPRAGVRHRAVRVAAERLRDRFASGPRCVSVRTLPLSSALYPTKYAFRAAAISPAPLVSFTHRCLLVQFFQRGALKN